MNIRIAKKHIDSGLTHSYTHDILCKALQDSLKPHKVKVAIYSLDYIFINNCLFDMPEKARELVYNSDHHKPIQPFHFDLPIPEDFFDADSDSEPSKM